MTRDLRLLHFKEFGAEEAPSLSTLFAPGKYDEQDKVIDYLKKGKVTLVSPQYDTDAFTGDAIMPLQTTYILSDRKYSWSSDLAYYVKMYNVRLPKEVEDWILSHYK